jgi:hypothetical protein
MCKTPICGKILIDGFDNKYVNFAYEEMAGNLQPEVNDPSVGASSALSFG